MEAFAAHRRGGVIERRHNRDVLVDHLNSIFSEPEMQENWNIRAAFKNGDEQPRYEFTIISQGYASAPVTMV